MSEPRKCRRCGAEMPADAPEGLCPECLLQQAMKSGSAPAQAQGATTPYSSGFVAPAPEDIAKHFPQLEILEILGQGGMGVVYKARQPKLDRFVALKILPPNTDPAFAERFTREARALAKLAHNGIVGVYDFGQTDGLYYFIMEFVDGVNLRHLLREGKLKPEEALKIVPQVCEALQYAHEESVVHRDIKPENILLDKKGRVKIADFGLAKLLGQTSDSGLTHSGQIMGTLHYMAPEQMEKPLEVDHRADIFSLGVVFYEMLTGELPLGRFAPPSQKVQVDVRLDEVVLRSLAKEPERRYQHVSEVKTQVDIIATSPVQKGKASPAGVPVPADTPAPPWLKYVTNPLWPLMGASIICNKVLDLDLDAHVFVWPLLPFVLVAFLCFLFERASVKPLRIMLGTMLLLAMGGTSLGLMALAFNWFGFSNMLYHLTAIEPGKHDPLALRISSLGMLVWSYFYMRRVPTWFYPLEKRLLDENKRWRELTPAQRVRAPALGLILAGVIQILGSLAITVLLGLAVVTTGSLEFPTVFVLLLLSASMAVGVVVIAGALKMWKLKSHKFSFSTSILAMLPLGYGCIVGLPFGAWALLVLRRPDVRASFKG